MRMKRKGSQSVVEEAGQGARTQAPHGRATMKRGPVSMGGERLAERRLLRAGAPPCLLACHRKPNQEQDRSPRPTTGLFALLCLSYLLGSSFAPPELTPGFPVRTFCTPVSPLLPHTQSPVPSCTHFPVVVTRPLHNILKCGGRDWKGCVPLGAEGLGRCKLP